MDYRKKTLTLNDLYLLNDQVALKALFGERTAD